jgi:poly-gamma-glutamate synthesis protein (capsule biosynthesis protein)
MILVAFIFEMLSWLFPSQEATLVFFGDAMQHQVQLDAARRTGNNYDYTDCFADVAPWVREADYAVVNLETTLGAKNFTGYPCFCSPDSYAKALKNAGFDLFLTANNHTLDRRDAGLRRTANVLDSLGVEHIGTYVNAAQRNERLPFVRNINGIKVAFLNYTYGTNGITVQGKVVVDYIDRALIKADIAAARRAGAEIIIAMPHWGVEYQLTENASQRSLAEFLHSEGVDVVIGGHPHVIQPMHLRNGRLVVYSMGNFISGMRTRDTRGGAAVKVHLKRDLSGKVYVESAGYRLFFTVPGNQYRVKFIDADTDVNATVGTAWASQCRAFIASAQAVFNRHNTAVPRLNN